jgi:7-carboxy-7-deazaguanine synthase
MAEYAYQLKFVCAAPGDLQEVEKIQRELDAPPHQIVVMPEGVNRDTLRDRSLWLAELCKERGYRFSPRLHIELWGDRRGI